MKKFLHGALVGLLVYAIALSAIAFPPKESYAVGIPFGGRITTITPCTNGFLITLGPPTPISIMYPWGALSYSFGIPRNPGQWLLGSAAPGGVCNRGLVNIPAFETILFHGSSAF